MIESSNLYREIHEQPAVIARFLKNEREHIARLAEDLNRKEIRHIVIAARGTSDNAARYAQYLFGAVNQMPVGLAAPSLHSMYHRPPVYRDALVIGISQSGKSPDIVSVIGDARRQGALTLAITNQAGSDLAQAAEHVLDLHAGVELSVAATKTYTSELAAIAALSAAAAGDLQMDAALQTVPDLIAETLRLSPEIARAAERYRYMKVCVVIGRGFNYATAFELALKIKELNYVIAEPYSSADFLHGPIAVLEDAFPTLVVAPSGVMLGEMREFVGSIRERGAEVIAISDDDELLALARTAFRLPALPSEWISPLVSIIPGQLFAMHLANVRDYDVDRPRGLRKVTETL
jgi:glucosamine--fructose-6-phosphate aminotransferase (isomerizing)